MICRRTSCLGQRLTRAGVAYILQKYVMDLKTVDGLPSSPHVIRHTKAMHLLQSGVSIVYIKDLLGHVDLKTTEVYARADLEMKRKALEKGDSVSPAVAPVWKTDSNLLTWLEELANPKQ
ncbi:tyrosine-type recombinase/integrase [bacterium]|nr:tyrosine-type recombinase/integrase [bacterium]